MRTLLLATALSFVALTGCSKSSKDDSAERMKNLPTVTVNDLDTALANHAAQPVDANGEATRKRLGVIPGAVLLTEGDDWAISELPADKAKPLVFYCANEDCGASHHAAAKALTAGYTNVKVLPDGIAGWVKAGKKTTSI
jgi:rhodanese-related sulfurtransferase